MKKIKQSSSTSTNHNNIFADFRRYSIKTCKKVGPIFSSDNPCPSRSLPSVATTFVQFTVPKIFPQFVKIIIQKRILKAKYTNDKSFLRLKTKKIIGGQIA